MQTGEIQCADLAVEQKLNSLATKRALADPLPGPVGEAFCSGPIEVGGKIVYQIVPRHFTALKMLNSPLISVMQDVVSTGAVDTIFSDEQSWELCWVFTHTGKEVKEALDKGGLFIKSLCEEIGDIPNYPVALVVAAIMEQLKRHMETSIRFTAEAQEKDEISFFRDLGTSQERGTAGS